MTPTTRLDISIGPVQGFVAQSRRTRDLWGSSYLLSYLSAHAIYGALSAGGRIIQPVVDDDPLFRWASGQRNGDVPRLGSLPNHFVIQVEEDPASVAVAAGEQLLSAWQRVCDAVRERYVERVLTAGVDTEDIWSRQVGGFWEVTWTAGSSEEPGGLLARRKHWRTHRPTEEPGDKCTVMHDLQELSGHVRAASARSRQKQDEFWQQLRARGRLSPLELRDNERLSAIALVKRLFPLVSDVALGWNVDQSRWPSTAHIAARPWIRKVVSQAPDLASGYAAALREHTRNIAATGAYGSLQGIDPDYLHAGSLDNERVCPLDESASPEARDHLLSLLAEIHETADEEGERFGTPPRFYALMLADGDRLGRLVGELGGPVVGEALSTFTEAVPDIVEAHGGVTVYAGGDDVLAMLPVERALECAAQIEESYRNSFTGSVAGTLSAAVIFAQVRHPLRSVIAEAHHLLDDIAKDGNGRNSLVVGVLKGSGRYCQWVTSWTRGLPDGGNARAIDLLHNLTAQLSTTDSEPGISGALLYRIRDTLSRLAGWERWRPGDWGSLPSGIDIRPFLQAEISRSLSVTMQGGAPAGVGDLVASVWNLLGRARADALNDGTAIEEAGVDALLLARFMTDPRREEDMH